MMSIPFFTRPVRWAMSIAAGLLISVSVFGESSAATTDARTAVAGSAPDSGAPDSGRTWYVDSWLHAGPHDGLSWETSFLTVGAALFFAGEGDVIRVAGHGPGARALQYTPGYPRTATIALKPGVTIQGGYHGYLGLPDNADDRDLVAFETIITGDLDRDGVHDAASSLHVVSALDPAIDNDTVLDGITIAGGYANGTGDDSRGAGLRVVNAAPRLVDCTFRDNAIEAAGVHGGGAAMSVEFRGGPPMTASLRAEGCTFDSNTSRTNGGGVMIYDDTRDPESVAFVGCAFSANVARGEDNGTGCAGALYVRSDDFGGDEPLTVNLVNSTFDRNYAKHIGGAISDKAHGLVRFNLVNCLLTHNGTNPTPAGPPTEEGGAIGIVWGVTLDVTNCTFSRNEAELCAGSLCWWDGGRYDRDCRVRNSIFWGDFGAGSLTNDGGDLDVDHSLVEGGGPGRGYTWTNSTAQDPLFRDPLTDFRPLPWSPAVDEGLSDHLPPDMYDLDDDGDTDEPTPHDLERGERVTRAPVDMGAYELVCTGDANGDGITGFADILQLLADWGPCGECPPVCEGDLDRDCRIGIFEILAVLANWNCGSE